MARISTDEKWETRSKRVKSQMALRRRGGLLTSVGIDTSPPYTTVPPMEVLDGVSRSRAMMSETQGWLNRLWPGSSAERTDAGHRAPSITKPRQASTATQVQSDVKIYPNRAPGGVNERLSLDPRWSTSRGRDAQSGQRASCGTLNRGIRALHAHRLHILAERHISPRFVSSDRDRVRRDQLIC